MTCFVYRGVTPLSSSPMMLWKGKELFVNPALPSPSVKVKNLALHYWLWLGNGGTDSSTD
eukprot:3048305-Amphidinium_carterae.1